MSPENLGMFSTKFHDFFGIFSGNVPNVSVFFFSEPDTPLDPGCPAMVVLEKTRGKPQAARFKDGSFYRLDHLYPEEMGFGW